MKMSDRMKLPVSDRFPPDFDDVSWPVVSHAINQHDKLVEALENMIPLAAAHACHDEDWALVDAALAVLNSEGTE